MKISFLGVLVFFVCFFLLCPSHEEHLGLVGQGQCRQPHPVSGLVSAQVARLMEMGFSRGDALEALRASNNDLNVATNFLLQH